MGVIVLRQSFRSPGRVLGRAFDEFKTLAACELLEHHSGLLRIDHAPVSVQQIP